MAPTTKAALMKQKRDFGVVSHVATPKKCISAQVRIGKTQGMVEAGLWIV